MDFWIRAAQLVLSLSILVVLHEFGHYIPAKLFKTRVEKFYLFFNPWFSLFKKKIGETEWGIGWLPLGGYVKISGMVDESMDKEQLAEPPKPWEFRSKPAWQRLIIMIGGVTVNLLLGILIYICVVYTYGVETIRPKDLQAGMSVHPYFEKYGIRSGDVIETLDGEPVNNVMEINPEIMLRGKRKLHVIHADGSKEIVTLPEDIDYQMFEHGAYPAVALRSRPDIVENIYVVEEYSDNSIALEKGDVIYTINGSQPDHKRGFEELLDSRKTAALQIIHGKDTVAYTISPEVFRKKILGKIPALKAGFRKGDQVISINGTKIEYQDQITSEVYRNKGKKIDLEVWRDGKKVQLTPSVSSEGVLGVMFKTRKPIDSKSIHTTYYSFGESISKGWNRGFVTLNDYVAQMKFLFTEKGASSIGGFGTIGKLFPPVWDWEIFWLNTAFISIVLAFMNILPIPALDGGHVVFLIYEIITGKEAPQKVLEYAQYVGFILLLGLLIYANGNDIYRAIFGG